MVENCFWKILFNGKFVGENTCVPWNSIDKQKDSLINLTNSINYKILYKTK